MSKLPLLFIAVVVLIVVLATRQYWQKKQQDAENDRAPVRSVQVEVVDKREVLAPNRRSRQREEIVAEEKRYEVYFRPLSSGIEIKNSLGLSGGNEIKSGSEIKMVLPQQEYNRIEQGAQGILRLQGTRYIGLSRMPRILDAYPAGKQII
ncbi:DUF2500 domain-containing protein [Yersinia pestis]|uniref:DUF2500 domain-containing protein n=2 Tax=Yersinia pestis TaxID=632 RepID=UPI0006B9E9AA|nr:DUF2500 domain-containing protein [Yersinia pestis]KAA5782181.1 DUF2500 domain-containing protein [Yersinia pestis]KPD39643.1 hypothetical protein AC471_18665 [Yersinia pestis subsp. microtus bv. Ulegeica]KPD43336.1 hypothetical protein AC472_11005 [Yersinia pestis subsp. microtus bv. Caucasica]KPD56833.1 hypothetical protein AC595_09870 [Yersinia pestis subsp. microtus bv. Xilingolensis]KPD90751.1 hypothetical protein ADT41_09480 [Yersinia pestis subsp. microtus bv. Caucasica]